MSRKLACSTITLHNCFQINYAMFLKQSVFFYFRRLHRVLQGASPRGRPLYFTFQVLQTLFKASTALILTLGVATPSGAPPQAPLEDYLSDTPPLRAMGCLVSQHDQLGAIPPALSEPFPLGEHGCVTPPPPKGSQRYLRDTT